ncbi:MAG: ABC transporter permease subunit [Proteobacteria bacterium]|nr:MAG: ABC transporter permease subunit [Pseudomonadota bacterium]
MIERFLKNENSIKAWRRFKARKSAVISCWMLIVIFFFSATAELWANRKPIVMKYHGQTYFPVFNYYHPSVFGIEGMAQTDYRNLPMENGDWALWPVIRWDPFERNDKLEEFPSGPSASNVFGTDDGGRDVAARLLYGFRYSMAYAIAVWVLSTIIGALAGALMGYAGGWTDLTGQRVIEVLESLPFLMILITLVSIFQPTLTLLVLLTVFFSWVSISIYFRAEFLKLRKREFIEAAHASGASKWRVIITHILPNSLTPWITISPFLIAGNISQLAALDFLGFGLQAPTPSWGELLNQALNYFRIAWWLAVYPSLALFLTLTILNLIGDGVRDALDPRK